MPKIYSIHATQICKFYFCNQHTLLQHEYVIIKQESYLTIQVTKSPYINKKPNIPLFLTKPTTKCHIIAPTVSITNF